MPATELAPPIKLELPYPGLRPFEADEAFLFYGRKSHTEELLRRLATNRFLAVVGTSGSGKSSLVRAGLLPVRLSIVVSLRAAYRNGGSR